MLLTAGVALSPNEFSYHDYFGIAILCPPINDGGCLPRDSYVVWSAIIAEAVGSFVFVLVLITAKYSKKGSFITKSFASSIGLYGAILLVRPISGAGLNPTVGFI